MNNMSHVMNIWEPKENISSTFWKYGK